jgi:hypothetical protein
MKNYIYSLFVLLLGCSTNEHSLRYEIYSTGVDSTSTPTTGYVKLDIYSVGDWSVGYIDIKTDSLTVKDSVVCSNYERGGIEFLDISLKTSGHRLIMYDNNWGLFKKGSDKVVVFYEGAKVKSRKG